MARTTHVKAAQQRYATVAVLDEQGNPKRTPVTRKKNGEQKTTKRGKPVTMAVTVADKSRPLPPETCDACHKPIEVGTPYKHVTPKSGPYGGRKRSRHESCPSWQQWDLSNSWSARVARVQYDAEQEIEAAESAEDVESARDSAAQAIRDDLVAASEEAADNLEAGFGHETSQSQEARDRAETLESWADDVEGVEMPEAPEPEDEDCKACSGNGHVEEATLEPAADGQPTDTSLDCTVCDGTGQVTPEEPSEEQMSNYLQECRDAVLSVLQESPI